MACSHAPDVGRELLIRGRLDAMGSCQSRGGSKKPVLTSSLDAEVREPPEQSCIGPLAECVHPLPERCPQVETLVREIFALYDLDGSGYIDAVECRKIRLGLGETEREARDTWDGMFLQEMDAPETPDGADGDDSWPA